MLAACNFLIMHADYAKEHCWKNFRLLSKRLDKLMQVNYIIVNLYELFGLR